MEMERSSNDPEYDALKRFMSWACDNGARSSDARPESHPMRILAGAEGKVPHSALKKGLMEAIGDVVTDFSRWTPEQVKAADKDLERLGAPTLTEMRLMFSTSLRRIEKRGVIENDEEFYLVRNALEMPIIECNPRRAKKLQAMADKYEFS